MNLNGIKTFMSRVLKFLPYKLTALVLVLFVAPIIDLGVGLYMITQSEEIKFINRIKIPQKLSENQITPEWISEQLIQSLSKRINIGSNEKSTPTYVGRAIFQPYSETLLKQPLKLLWDGPHLKLDISKNVCEFFSNCENLIDIDVVNLNKNRRITLTDSKNSFIHDVGLSEDLHIQVTRVFKQSYEPCDWFIQQNNKSRPTEEEWIDCNATVPKDSFEFLFYKAFFLSFEELRAKESLELALKALNLETSNNALSRLALKQANLLFRDGLISKYEYKKIIDRTEINLKKNQEDLKLARFYNDVLINNGLDRKSLAESLDKHFNITSLDVEGAALFLQYIAFRQKGISKDYLIRDLILDESVDVITRLYIAAVVARSSILKDDVKYLFSEVAQDSNHTLSLVASLLNDTVYGAMVEGTPLTDESMLVRASSKNPLASILVGIFSDQFPCEDQGTSVFFENAVSLLMQNEDRSALENLVLGEMFVKGIGTDIRHKEGIKLVRDSIKSRDSLNEMDKFIYHLIYGLFEVNGSDSFNATIENIQNFIKENRVFAPLIREMGLIGNQALSIEEIEGMLEEYEGTFFKAAALIHSAINSENPCLDNSELNFNRYRKVGESTAYVAQTHDSILELAIARLVGRNTSSLLSRSEELLNVERDYEKAFRGFVLLSHENVITVPESREAKYFIAKMYRRGFGVPKSCSASKYWFSKALSEGVKLAEKTKLGVCYD